MLGLEMCVAPAKSKEHPGCFCVTAFQTVPVIVLQMVSPDTCGKVLQGYAEPHTLWKMLLSPSFQARCLYSCAAWF